MLILTICFVFILGAAIGSFISVLVDRIKKGKKGIFMGRSECPKCKEKLRTTDLIPIISYLFLKGKCRYCKKPIGTHYPALELFSGLTFVTILINFNFINETNGISTVNFQTLLTFGIYSIYEAFFIAIFFYDLLNSEIPDIFLFPIIGITLIGSLILGTPNILSMGIALGISLIIFGGQYLLSRGTWIGEGDVYFAIAMAFAFGWQLLLVAIFLTYIFGGITAVILLAAKKVSKKTHIPFAPFMVLGSLLTIFFGSDILNWYLKSIAF
jgi:leader peptidase (prepilin peptidase)/N-methyltransferase